MQVYSAQSYSVLIMSAPATLAAQGSEAPEP
jgi:hypothetical protein